MELLPETSAYSEPSQRNFTVDGPFQVVSSASGVYMTSSRSSIENLDPLIRIFCNPLIFGSVRMNHMVSNRARRLWCVALHNILTQVSHSLTQPRFLFPSTSNFTTINFPFSLLYLLPLSPPHQHAYICWLNRRHYRPRAGSRKALQGAACKPRLRGRVPRRGARIIYILRNT